MMNCQVNCDLKYLYAYRFSKFSERVCLEFRPWSLRMSLNIISFQNPASLKWNQRWPKWQSADWGHGWWTTCSSSSPSPVSPLESSLASSWSLWSWTLSLSPTSGTQENSLCGFWNSWFYLWLLLPWLLVSKFTSSAFRQKVFQIWNVRKHWVSQFRNLNVETRY